VTAAIEKPFAWYLWVLACLPVILLLGGAAGALIGGFAFVTNVRVSRSEKVSAPFALVSSLGLTLSGIALWYVVASRRLNIIG